MVASQKRWKGRFGTGMQLLTMLIHLRGGYICGSENRRLLAENTCEEYRNICVCFFRLFPELACLCHL